MRQKNTRIFLDKVLHNRHQLSDTFLTSSSTRVVFMLRQPKETLLSTVSLYRKKAEKQIYAKPEHATEYYVKRLERLMKHASLLNMRFFYLDADALTKSPQATLANLGDWLQFSEPLNAEYTIFKKTGATGAGDSSKNISSGRIVDTKSDYEGPEIPAQLLDRAQSAFDDCRSMLMANCAESATT